MLFNVGAHYAQVAATLDLSTLDGLRLAATYFQVSCPVAALCDGVNANSSGHLRLVLHMGGGDSARRARLRACTKNWRHC